MLDKISNFFKTMPAYFKKAGQSMTNWPLYKKIDCGFWLLTGVFMITLIIMFAVYSSTIGEKVNKILTDTAVMQQNVVAAIALVFLVFLILAIFTLVIGIAQSKKKKGAK